MLRIIPESSRFRLVPADVPAVGLAVLLIVLWTLTLTAYRWAEEPVETQVISVEPRV